MCFRLSVGIFASSAHDTNVDINDSTELLLFDEERRLVVPLRRGVRDTGFGGGGPPAKIDEVNFLRGVLLVTLLVEFAGVGRLLLLLLEGVEDIGEAFGSIGGGVGDLLGGASRERRGRRGAAVLLAGGDFLAMVVDAVCAREGDGGTDDAASCSFFGAFCAVERDAVLDERRVRGAFSLCDRVSLFRRSPDIDLRTVDVDGSRTI